MPKMAQNCQKISFLAITLVFTTRTSHMIPFWNPWGYGITQEVIPEFLVTIRMIRKAKNGPLMTKNGHKISFLAINLTFFDNIL